MSLPDGGVSRRGMLATVGIAVNGVVGLILAVPIVRYLLSPMIRANGAPESWLSLGELAQFPQGETRLASYRHPAGNQADGETANIPCWVRHVDGEKFQVFAINCAHLGCPVRWFPQSGLFMCPCHGGVYYSDGARASGPPERGLFEYAYKIEQGNLLIKTGDMPTPGINTAGLINISPKSTQAGCAGCTSEKPPCA
jgi:menaquinol-cytochrome c reductase iron-sulfur subunit